MKKDEKIVIKSKKAKGKRKNIATEKNKSKIFYHGDNSFNCHEAKRKT